MRLRAAVLLGCAAWGCTSSTPAPVCTLMTVSNQVQDPAGVEHHPMVVEFPVGLMSLPGCPEPDIEAVEATVLDPLDEPVPNVTTLTSKKLNGAIAVVSFTPARFGPYHFSVRFEQSVATMQTDLQVAADRSDAGFHTLALTPFTSCNAFDVAAGVPLCHDLASRALTAYSDGGTSQIIVDRFSVDDAGRVWATDYGGINSLLHVYSVDDGGSPSWR